MKAVERLLEAGKYPEAVSRIRSILSRFPDHGGLHSALVEALEQTQNQQAAALAAFVWAERRPHSLPAQTALLAFASQLGHLLLADQAAEKVRALGEQTPGFPLAPEVTKSFLEESGTPNADIETLLRFDVGKLHLEGQDFSGALRWLEGVEMPPARNNRALALFHLGRVEEALDTFLTTWQQDATSLYALAWAARLRLYLDDATGAQGLSVPLAAAEAGRADDAMPQIEVLLLLRQDQAAWDAFARARSNGWTEAPTGFAGAMLRHLGGCAACRLGDLETARRWWSSASSARPDLGLGRENLEFAANVENQNRLPAVFDLHKELPHAWTETLSSAKTDPSNPSGTFATLTASNVYLEALYFGGNQMLRKLVGFVLKYRAEHGDAAAADLLRAFARLPIGTTQERFNYLGFLRSKNLIGAAEPVEIWDSGTLQSVTITGTEIYRESVDSDLPPDLLALLTESISLFNEGRVDESEVPLLKILERIPKHRVALANLAAVRSAQGRHEETLQLLREVVEAHPDYLFGRCSLAQVLIDEGEIDEAEPLLDGLMERERMHVQEAFMVCGTLAMLHTAKGEGERAQVFLADLEAMVEDEDDERRLKQIKRRVERLDPTKRFERELLQGLMKRRADEPPPN
jgi:tetratricopeptide (TPR) repeat protein